MAVEAGAGDHSGVPRTPGHVEAPLVGRRQLTLDLGGIGVPAQNTIVFTAGQEQIRVL